VRDERLVAPPRVSAGALSRIAAGAAERDAEPRFPADAFAVLAAERALLLTAEAAVTRADEWAAVRAVAAADGSVGRLYEGHLNAVERVALLAPEPVRAEALAAVAEGRVLGVWGADPLPIEGEPAWLEPAGGGWALRGVKVFCSGAGGLDRALVTARHPLGGPPRLAFVALDDAVEVDRTWFRGAGMRASESHRVAFHGARVLALLGGPGELVREPWFSRDAIRTAAAWAGLADCAADEALAQLAARPEPDDAQAIAAARIVAARATIDRWFEHGAARADAEPGAPLVELAVQLRLAVAEAGRSLLDEAARACGSRPFAIASPLDRARRDFELFVLQHRLEPLLVRAGRRLLGAGR